MQEIAVNSNIKKIKQSGKYFSKSNNERKIAAFLFLAPFTILFILFIVIPVLYSMFLSFTNYNMIEAPKFIGLANYKTLFLTDDVFFIALKNTLIFACFIGPLGYILQFLLAWIINSLPFRKFFTFAFYAPSLVGGGMMYIWLYLFSSDRYGFINNFLINLGFINAPILWTVQADNIFAIVVLISIWQGMGASFLVLLAGLQNVSAELYEAGKVDGIGNKLQELIYITLPMMKPQMLFAAVNSIVGSFAVFEVAKAIAGFPSQNYVAHTIVGHLFDHAFIRAEMGYASAIAMVLFVITFSLGRVAMKIFANKE